MLSLIEDYIINNYKNRIAIILIKTKWWKKICINDNNKIYILNNSKDNNLIIIIELYNGIFIITENYDEFEIKNEYVILDNVFNILYNQESILLYNKYI